MRDQPVFFLKATTKKKVWIPTYNRGSSVVEGHYAFVHVADGHDDARVASGDGTHSQKQAHAALSRHDWFHGLSDEHRAKVVMERATGIQEKASAAARVSTFRKKALAGERVTSGEFRAFQSAPPDKQRALAQELREAGRIDVLPEAYRNLEAPAPREPKRRDAPKFGDEREGDFGQDKAPQSADKVSPGDSPGSLGTSPGDSPGAVPGEKPTKPITAKSTTVEEHLAKLDSMRLPAGNVNAKSVNAKIDVITSALKLNDPGLLTMLPYGTNTYGKKSASLANEALELLGSSERVKAGQKGVPGYRSDAQIAAAKKNAKEQRTVDPDKDSLMTAIAKLGGLNASNVAKQWGYSKKDAAGYRVGILPVFSSNGKSIEQMVEALHELGYLESDSHTELEEHVGHGMGGGDHFTPTGYANKAAADFEDHYQGLTAEDAQASGFDQLLPEAQTAIEEFLDENPNFTADEIAAFERVVGLDDDDIPFDSDFGAEKSRHGDFGETHARPRGKGGEAGDDVPF